jgi:hypothetical protein
MGGIEPVEYTYDYMNDNPGVLPHVLTTQDGEIRDPNGGIWGTFNEKPTARGGSKRIVENSGGRGDLPATTPDSMFADEREWVASGKPFQSLRGSVEAVIAVYDSRDIDPVAKWEELFETIPTLADIYVYHISGESGSIWGSSTISTVVAPPGEVVDVDDVPTALRNGDEL